MRMGLWSGTGAGEPESLKKPKKQSCPPKERCVGRNEVAGCRTAEATERPMKSEERIPQGRFIAHTRLTVLLTEQWRILDLAPAPHPLVHGIHVVGTGKNLITWLNWALAHTTTDPLQLLRKRWEQNVGRELQDKEWDRVLIYHKLFFQKR
ncbi:hypothetical protein NDU88_006455 [Pleurodeles waltl]|uniref:Uncharacterized protein n=1 Tax=Pleurodeles waltl TaxID=8319 RepID=A0AAV7LP59_PLEWA|nr:hypothetical protein NDU88_006455 [Pleurodeles waltl]